MSYSSHYSADAPEVEEVARARGALVLEFGSNWCSHCKNAQPLIEKAMEGHPSVRHLKIEDGKGRRLGRTFGVKLWPTLIFLEDGQEVTRLVRPGSSSSGEDINKALSQIDQKH